MIYYSIFIEAGVAIGYSMLNYRKLNVLLTTCTVQ